MFGSWTFTKSVRLRSTLKTYRLRNENLYSSTFLGKNVFRGLTNLDFLTNETQERAEKATS